MGLERDCTTRDGTTRDGTTRVDDAGRTASERRRTRRGRTRRALLATLVAAAVVIPLSAAARPEIPAPAPAVLARSLSRKLTRYRAAFVTRVLGGLAVRRRTNPRGGLIVVVVGMDGAGKSTVIESLRRIFGTKLDVDSIYMGSGDGRKSLLRTPLSALRRLARGSAETRVSEIILAVDEPIKATRCTEMGATGCRADRSKCLTHDLWEELGNQIHAFLSGLP